MKIQNFFILSRPVFDEVVFLVKIFVNENDSHLRLDENDNYYHSTMNDNHSHQLNVVNLR